MDEFGSATIAPSQQHPGQPSTWGRSACLLAAREPWRRKVQVQTQCLPFTRIQVLYGHGKEGTHGKGPFGGGPKKKKNTSNKSTVARSTCSSKQAAFAYDTCTVQVDKEKKTAGLQQQGHPYNAEPPPIASLRGLHCHLPRDLRCGHTSLFFLFFAFPAGAVTRDISVQAARQRTVSQKGRGGSGGGGEIGKGRGMKVIYTGHRSPLVACRMETPHPDSFIFLCIFFCWASGNVHEAEKRHQGRVCMGTR